ncbi:lipid binding protein [Fusarium globosum]|uniref:Lipid binding protein n=1 Tax=Fusarium globosum TaxID=78864 RepID=A0A8H5Y6E3_9HYPO|nr:lipid binding protein [Fusarium globosum]
MSSALSNSLAESKLVPGSAASLIPEGFKPTTNLKVSFDGKDVDLGNLFRATECKRSPGIQFGQEPDAPGDATYMLLLVDPDAPTPDDPKFAFWRHWVLPGLRPLSGGDAVAQVQPALTEYLGPGPKDDSKPHRYLLLLYRQPASLDLAKEDVGGEEFTQRRSFDTAKFVEKHGLQLVGANWFLGAGDGWKE